MITLNNCYSIGCIDYGNNNFYEVMTDGLRFVLVSHDEEVEMDDNGVCASATGLSIPAFMHDIHQRPDYQEIMDELNQLIAS